MVCTKRSAAPRLSPLAVSVRTPLAICYSRRSWYPFKMYRDLETRKEMRERAWEVDGWADTVHKARLGPRVHYHPAHMTHRLHSWHGRWIRLF